MPASSLPHRVFGTFSSLLKAPWRLFNERTSAQLIASYVAVVLVVILLFQITVVAFVLAGPRLGLLPVNRYTVDPYIGERAAAYVQWLGPDRISEAISTDSRGILLQGELDRRLRQLVAGSVPGLEDISATFTTNEAIRAAIVTPDGEVLVASDGWVETGFRIPATPLGGPWEVVRRNMDLAGRHDPAWDAHYSMTATEGVTTAAYPVLTGDGPPVATFVIQGGSLIDRFGASRGDVARDLSLAFLQTLWVFAIPAVIVAIPFGYWRARAMSRRLQRLAGAAEAMADGNLQTRVRVSRKDEIGRLAESFNDMARQIDHNDQARRAFVSNISHELRTPVSIIQGTTERLRMETGKEYSEIDRALAVIQHETAMLTRLIDDLFTIARLEEHSLRLVRTRFDLANLVEHTLSGIRDLAWTQQKISIESLISPDLPPVYADTDRVRQIISNLVYNALRHTPEGGLVVVQAHEHSNHIEVEVSDTGVGIEDTQLETIFTRYYQTERTQRSGIGSGLGLAIVAQLVEALGGEISVTSELGTGTTFRFALAKGDGTPAT